MRAVNLVENWIKMCFLLTLVTLIYPNRVFSQTLEDIARNDTIIIKFDKSDSFYKWELSEKEFKGYQQSCSRYILKFKDTIDNSVITFTDCKWKDEPSNLELRVHRNWIRNKPVLDQAFFHQLGFKNSSTEIPFHEKVVYMYDETMDTLKNDSLDLFEIKIHSSFIGFE